MCMCTFTWGQKSFSSLGLELQDIGKLLMEVLGAELRSSIRKLFFKSRFFAPVPCFPPPFFPPSLFFLFFLPSFLKNKVYLFYVYGCFCLHICGGGLWQCAQCVCLVQGDARREYWILWLELQMVAGTWIRSSRRAIFPAPHFIS